MKVLAKQRKENDRMAKEKTNRNLALGALFGVVAGFITGILTAPKKGTDTRKDIKDKAEKVTGSAEKSLKDLY